MALLLSIFQIVQFSLVVQLCSTLQPHGLQHPRLPSPSPAPGVCSNSCPLSQWCHPTILSSVVPVSSCLQSFPASGSFPVSRHFASGGQSIGASASVSVLPMYSQEGVRGPQQQRWEDPRVGVRPLSWRVRNMWAVLTLIYTICTSSPSWTQPEALPAGQRWKWASNAHSSSAPQRNV